MKIHTSTPLKTAAAIIERWGYLTPEQRWEDKKQSIVLFIARLGWSTVEMTNYFLFQSKRDWVTKMINENLLVSKVIVIDEHPAYILVLTRKGQILAKSLDGRIGRRINKEVTRQARHDLIAGWVATWFLNSRHDFKIERAYVEMWSDRILRRLYPKDKGWPDIAMQAHGDIMLHIEIERTRKTKPEEHYHFLKKLERYQQNGIETIVVFEKLTQANLFVDDLNRAEHFGVNSWIENADTKKWYELKRGDREIIELQLMIGIWDHQSKKMINVIYHNYPDYEDKNDTEYEIIEEDYQKIMEGVGWF